jgi:hypothetical protein
MRGIYFYFAIALIACAFFVPASAFTTFIDACNASYYAHHLNDSRSGLVDLHGKPVSDIKLAAGIDVEKCYEVCGGGYQVCLLAQNLTIGYLTVTGI